MQLLAGQYLVTEPGLKSLPTLSQSVSGPIARLAGSLMADFDVSPRILYIAAAGVKPKTLLLPPLDTYRLPRWSNTNAFVWLKSPIPHCLRGGYVPAVYSHTVPAL